MREEREREREREREGEERERKGKEGESKLYSIKNENSKQRPTGNDRGLDRVDVV